MIKFGNRYKDLAFNDGDAKGITESTSGENQETILPRVSVPYLYE